MNNEGWTLGDLAGELMVRGINIDDVSSEVIAKRLHQKRPEEAAGEIARELYCCE
jgi:hypothetical protein